IPARDLLHGDAVGEEVAAGSPHLLREGQAEDAQLSHLADYVVGEAMLAVEVLGRGRDHLAAEVASQVADRLLLVGQVEIHGPILEVWRVRPRLRFALPVIRYDLALSRVHALQGKEGSAVNPLCRTLLLSGEGRAGRCFVLLHGFTNCPQQFLRLAEELHSGGDAVLVPRYPYHGLTDRLTKEPSRLTTEELIRFANDVTDMAQGLGRRVIVAGLSLGALLAMWLAQHRADVGRAVAISPVFGLRRLPTGLVRWAAGSLPDRYLWWDP